MITAVSSKAQMLIAVSMYKGSKQIFFVETVTWNFLIIASYSLLSFLVTIGKVPIIHKNKKNNAVLITSSFYKYL